MKVDSCLARRCPVLLDSFVRPLVLALLLVLGACTSLSKPDFDKQDRTAGMDRQDYRDALKPRAAESSGGAMAVLKNLKNQAFWAIKTALTPHGYSKICVSGTALQDWNIR
ncbi:MAG: hypothetical protein EXR08_12070 [Alphaproteobacteria bacterium]|nr:hypothetical protein [Alphaproteobacteria bacterium]